MTINNLKLNQYVVEIHRASSRLDYLQREGREHELFMELRNLELAAEDAMTVLNDLRRKAA